MDENKSGLTAEAEGYENLFDASFFDRVSRLKLAITKKSAQNYQGRRRSALKGSSAEFSDFREYMPGDDVRRVDWNVYARLDKPYVREYMEEREGAVNIFLDMTASMGFWGKDRLAKQLAGAMALISLSNLDRIGVHIIMGSRIRSLRFSGSKGNVKRALSMIEKATPGISGDLAEAVRSVAYLPRGLTILISDFMEESFLSEGENLCRYLRFRGQEVILLQVSADEERNVRQSGTFRLEDAEGVFESVRLNLDDTTLLAYEKEYSAFLGEVSALARSGGARYFLCRTESGWERVLFEDLRSIYDL